MVQEQIALLVGDAYLCEHALDARHTAIRSSDTGCERYLAFADEIDPASFEADLQATPLFTLGRHFVVRRVEKAKKAARLAAALSSPLPKDTFLTLIASELRATNPVRKALGKGKGTIMLPSPKGRAVKGATEQLLASHRLPMADDALQVFIYRCNNDLLTMQQEAKKLAAYGVETPVSKGDVERLVFANADQTVYPFYDRLGEGRLCDALKELCNVRDDPGRVLGGAIRHISRLTMVRLLIDRRVPPAAMTSLIGVPDWLLRRLNAQARRHSLAKLNAALDLGLSLDTRIKSGDMSSADALFHFVLSVTRP